MTKIKERQSKFSPEVRRQLADRAGHHCSICCALTTCSDQDGKPFRIADAAHKLAASPGGPRYRPKQTDRERGSANNGIWLCASCHKKVDGDEYRYTEERLEEMKLEAEDRARRLVHGEIVFEMKDKQQAAIETYLAERPFKSCLINAKGAQLGIQLVPFLAISARPTLSYNRLSECGICTMQNSYLAPPNGSSGEGVSLTQNLGPGVQQVTTVNFDATTALWTNYPDTAPRELYSRSLDLDPEKIAGDIVKAIRYSRIMFDKLKINDPRLIVRTQLFHIGGKTLVDYRTGNLTPRASDKPTVMTNYILIGPGEERLAAERLWYASGGFRGLPEYIEVEIQKVLNDLP